VDLRDDARLPLEPGVTRFNLLRAGYYKVAANVELPAPGGQGATVHYATASPVFEVRAGAAVPPITLTVGAGAAPM
jgi:hypothetical protein